MAGLLELLLSGGVQDPRARLGGEDTPAGGGLLDAVGQRIMAQQAAQQQAGQSAPAMAFSQPAQPQQGASGAPSVSMPQQGGGGILGALFGGNKRGNINSTVQWLVGKGYDPGAAEAIASDPQSLRAAMMQVGGPQSNDPKSGLMSVGENSALYNARTGEWIRNPNSGSGKDARKTYGNEVIWAQKPDGTWAAMRTASDGSLIEAPVAEGMRLAPPGAATMDLGTEMVIRDRAGNIIGREKKDVAGEAAQGVVGKGAGEAQLALPGAEGLAEAVKKQVIELAADPYLPNMVGPLASRLPNVTGDSARVQAKINQLQGGAFMQARELLKGGGQITDYEGGKAEEAYARLSTAQTVEDFKQALNDFSMYVDMGLRKLRSQASMGGGNMPKNDDPLGIR